MPTSALAQDPPDPFMRGRRGLLPVLAVFVHPAHGRETNGFPEFPGFCSDFFSGVVRAPLTYYHRTSVTICIDYEEFLNDNAAHSGAGMGIGVWMRETGGEQKMQRSRRVKVLHGG